MTVRAERKISRVPLTVWSLGIMTFFLNLSSIMIFSLSPLYLTQVFGLAAVYLGIFEGGIEFCSWMTRIFAGVFSDYLRKRKPVLLLACLLTVVARPIFAIANHVGWIYAAKLLDRIANGFQATPREALVGDVSPAGIKGTCYGLRQSLGVIGSLLGALLLMYLMRITGNDYQSIFCIAGILPVLALIVLTIFVKDAPNLELKQEQEKQKPKYFTLFLQKVKLLDRHFWGIISVAGIFMMSNYSGAYRILQAESTGFPVSDVSLIMIAQNLGTMIAAFPMGWLSDAIDRRILLAFGFFLTITANLLLGFTIDTTGIMVGAVLWGMQMGVTQSILSTMVSETVHRDLRGTAFGVYYFVIAFSLFFANTLMGSLSNFYGLTTGFMTSATIAGLSLFLVFLVISSSRKKKAIE